MRINHNINQNWLFTKDACTIDTLQNANFDVVHLPHTWNNLDGQDGGEPYYRGLCWYKKNLLLTEDEKAKDIYIEFKGANHIANVWINNHYLGEHKGGFSTFRYNVTDFLKKDGTDELIVSVSNAQSQIYPQAADFTFDGGLYRDVNLIAVDKTHISLDKCGSAGVFVTPTVKNNKDAHIRVDSFITNLKGQTIVTKILDADRNVIAEGKISDEHAVAEFDLENVHLWNGRNDPYQYIACVEIYEENQLIDEVEVQFGIREYCVDANKGFILNGKPYHLHGVSRHQCRQDMGWAITPKQHEEDLNLIKDVGANTIRLAHYQHDQYFYDICDRDGLVLWAEIPFISVFMPGQEAYDNTISQMTELVVENYNHASIFFWGISNEITIGGENEELLRNLTDLNNLAKKLDPSRLTTIAHMSMVKMDSVQHKLTDIIAYNHYFGWYNGEVEQNGPWMDKFHEMNPDVAVGLSEYGCEAILKWHTDTPKRKDYTEEYQAFYHEKMLEQFATRPYIWGTYVWNMFDFAADNRDEGGVQGRNNKGLVTFDRKTKKDSYFIYKAYWTTEPFVHITGRRYVDRPQDAITVKVYSNQPEVTLIVNGEKHSTVQANKIFIFENVKLKQGENTLIACAEGAFDDCIKLNKVDEPNANYVLVENEVLNEDARNWFKDLMPESEELTFNDGYYSTRDIVGDLMSNPEAAIIIKENVFDRLPKQKNLMTGEESNEPMAAAMFKEAPFEMVWEFMAKGFPANALAIINEKLQKIKK
ncbi:glycoside hydrolase family 2 protein [Anaerorhabdus sp.]|uniref:glycoside hydrolase family 2 protein n=1 Tax=Anaerorhabdus sp. TaxID=1872524 RepID=UPI002FC9D9B7